MSLPNNYALLSLVEGKTCWSLVPIEEVIEAFTNEITNENAPEIMHVYSTLHSRDIGLISDDEDLSEFAHILFSNSESPKGWCGFDQSELRAKRLVDDEALVLSEKDKKSKDDLLVKFALVYNRGRLREYRRSLFEIAKSWLSDCEVSEDNYDLFRDSLNNEIALGSDSIGGAEKNGQEKTILKLSASDQELLTLFSVIDLAKLLKVGKNTAYEYARAYFPECRVGKQYRIPLKKIKDRFELGSIK